MTMQPGRVPLRRNGFTWLLVHLNALPVALSCFLLIGGLVAGRAVPFVVGIGVAVLALSPGLLGASILDGHLESGYKWRRLRIPLSDVEKLTVGKVERFGFWGGEANGLKLTLSSGQVLLVRESQFCTTRRLHDWSDSITDVATSARVVHERMQL